MDACIGTKRALRLAVGTQCSIGEINERVSKQYHDQLLHAETHIQKLESHNESLGSFVKASAKERVEQTDLANKRAVEVMRWRRLLAEKARHDVDSPT